MEQFGTNMGVGAGPVSAIFNLISAKLVGLKDVTYASTPIWCHGEAVGTFAATSSISKVN
jgi:hypothetical protein